MGEAENDGFSAVPRNVDHQNYMGTQLEMPQVDWLAKSTEHSSSEKKVPVGHLKLGSQATEVPRITSRC